MSSYLKFYLAPKKVRERYVDGKPMEEKLTEGKPMALLSYSRNHPIYQAFYEGCNIAYAFGKEGEEKYTEITSDMFEDAIEAVDVDIKSTEQRLEVDYKVMKANFCYEVYEGILSSEKYLAELKENKEMLVNLKDFLLESVHHSDFEKILANVD